MRGESALMLIVAVLASAQAQATTVTVAEPGMLSLLGLGAVVAVLTLRFCRR